MASGKIFFSYSRDDSEFVLKLAKDLRAEGANIWLDQLDIPAGKRWDAEIEQALEIAEVQLVILSPTSVGSNNVMDEVSYALEKGKLVIPILHKDCQIPFRLKRLQYLNFTNNYDKGFKELSKALNFEKIAEKENDSKIIVNGQPEKPSHKQASIETEQKQKIERDLDLARKIQQGLLPQCIPDMNGLDICGEMIPAMQVGGDYYDLIQISDSKLFVVVGDVSGKGLSASLYMTKLQTMIKLSCSDNKSPKEILIDINKRIYTELDKSWFVTITLALFDLEKQRLTFCRAGHMPVLQATNGTVQSYRTQGLGVGIEKGIVFEKSLVEEEVKLSPGQIYAFFTDGVTEAMNEKNELFGDENLNAILKNKSKVRSSDIVNEIWSSVKSFRGEAEVNDDMTMVVVKVK